jgi:hypothetical protein
MKIFGEVPSTLPFKVMRQAFAYFFYIKGELFVFFLLTRAIAPLYSEYWK